jgi:hypothetical protein
MARPQRHTAGIGPYLDLVVIYLGMRARTPRGLVTLLQVGPRVRHLAPPGRPGPSSQATAAPPIPKGLGVELTHHETQKGS